MKEIKFQVSGQVKMLRQIRGLLNNKNFRDTLFWIIPLIGGIANPIFGAILSTIIWLFQIYTNNVDKRGN